MLTHPSATTKTPDLAAQKKATVMELSAGDTVLIEARELRIVLPVSGSLTALRQATVKSKVAADVRETPLAEGMPVARGQIVVRLDGADLAARLATQQAAQDDAKARLALARKNRENNLALLQQKFISQNAVDTAQNSVELAEAAVKSAASQLDIARRAIDDAVVRSPIDGIISKRFVQAGEKASPDMPLFSVVSLKEMVLEAQVPASEIPKVSVGQSVGFTVEGFGNTTFAGRVARINPAAEAGSRAITVYVAVDNPNGMLKSGMFAKGGITLQQAPPLPLLPMAALRNLNGKPAVYMLQGRTIVAQPVTPGLRNEDEGQVQITAGLAPGSRVLIVPLDNVKVGGTVRLPGDPPSTAAPVAAAVPAART
ncbi:MAG: efflux RND transporter periplasmic adaptor subunit [Herminiimonas sp.]|nr:efflux RND transporter periplasmic adaptor subunit [Herminiimonas sp.]